MTTSRIEVSALRSPAILLSSVPALLGSILGLASVAYLLGWFVADSYYSEIGAPWIAMELGNSRLLLFAAFPTIILALSVGLFVASTDPHSSDVRRLTRLGWIAAAIATAGTFVCLLVSDSLSGMWLVRVAYAVSVAWIVSAAAHLTSVAMHLERSAQRQGLYALVMMTVLMFVLVPHLLGRSAARLKLERGGIALPSVALSDAGPREDWRLLTRIGSDFYLIDVKRLPQRRFRVVTATNVGDVTAP